MSSAVIGGLLAGLILLVLGAELLVRGASRLAAVVGISPLVVGLTVVAFGTSAPELAVSVQSSLNGQADIALGNVVGSNIFDILAVLGISALIAPRGIRVAPTALEFDIPVMLVAALACLPVFFSGNCIARWEGAVFLGDYVAYTVYLVLHATQHPELPEFTTALMLLVQ